MDVMNKRKSKYKSWTNSRLKEVLNENYCRGVNGHDYEVVKEELQEELWERESKNADKEIERMLKEREEYENQ